MKRNSNDYKITLDYIPLHSGEYLNKLIGYDFLESGAFVRIVHLCVITNFELPDIKIIYRRVGAITEEERKAVDNILEDAKTYIFPIIQRQQQLRKKRIIAGKKGGEAKALLLKEIPSNARNLLEQKTSKTLAKADFCSSIDTNTNTNTNTNNNTNIKNIEDTNVSSRQQGKPVDMDGNNISFYYRQVPAWFNEILGDICTKCVDITESRKKAIKGRHSYFKNQQNWILYFRWVKLSDFLIGQVECPLDRESPWCVDFDWLLSSKKISKVLEGNYHKGGVIVCNTNVASYYEYKDVIHKAATTTINEEE
jgi:uncharacterized protein YdaU (DUF1376 family)